MVLRVESGEWHWDGVRLGLLEPEASLLAALLREPGERRLPHVWISLARHQPIAPASGRAFLTTLRRKLEWAGAPGELIKGDTSLGVFVEPEPPLADDDQTRAALHPDPEGKDDATTA